MTTSDPRTYLYVESSFCTSFNEHDIEVTSFSFSFLYGDLPVKWKKIEVKQQQQEENFFSKFIEEIKGNLAGYQ